MTMSSRISGSFGPSQNSEEILDDRLRGCHGASCSPQKVQNWVERAVVQNVERVNNGQPRSTLSIWGLPGLGKTSVVKQLASHRVEFLSSNYMLQDLNKIDFDEVVAIEVRQDGKTKWIGNTSDSPNLIEETVREAFRPESPASFLTGRAKLNAKIRIVDIPLAQIEEMGDALGYPVEEIEFKKNGVSYFVKAVDSIIRYHIDRGAVLTGNKRTTNAPPEWAPSLEVPGVILFDDGNRANQRIMKGLMQLAQDYKTISWSLPAGWTIVFTGNPDNRYNQVTSMDAAQLTRMKHITLAFNKKEWANWATQEGLDNRGINWVLFPENDVIGKELTNPRTLSEFFRNMKQYPSLFTTNAQGINEFNKEVARELEIEALSCIDPDTWESIKNFLLHENNLVIEPEMVLDYPDKAIKKLEELKNMCDGGRTDCMTVSCDRLVSYLLSDQYVNEKHHVKNFLKFTAALKVVNSNLLYSLLYDLAEASKSLVNMDQTFWFGPEGQERQITRKKDLFVMLFLGDESLKEMVAQIINPDRAVLK